jgi:hypothetical protein
MKAALARLIPNTQLTIVKIAMEETPTTADVSFFKIDII